MKESTLKNDAMTPKDVMKFQDKVYTWLLKWEVLRDSDMKLYSFAIRQWYKKRGIDMSEITALQMAEDMAKNKKFPKFETVARARRKVQEMYPMLRGKTDKERQKKSDQFREHFKYN